METNKEVQVTFQNSRTQDWASIAGTATTASNDDPRIKEIYGPTVSAWFGDPGDGVHTGKADDPRLALIEVKARYITCWISKVSSLGFLKEIGLATRTGQVADNGIVRELLENEIQAAREKESQ